MMTLELAERILGSVKDAASEAGIAAAGVVLDAGGYPVALVRMDGCRLLAADVAKGKAYTAAVFRMASGRVAEVAQKDPTMWNSVVASTGNKLILGAGALPILSDGQVIGALGVSGGSAQQDEAMAFDALRTAGCPSS